MANRLQDILICVLMAHFLMRGSLNYPGVVYLESLYFVAYLIITISIINNFLYYSSRKVPLIKYKEGLAFRALYWPVVCLLLLVVTIFPYF